MPAILTLTLNPAVDISTAVDRIVPTEKLRCAAPLVHPGGGGINVARVAARLGSDVVALHAAGGATGELLASLLRREHLANEVVPVAGSTRENYSVREASTGKEYRFVLPGPELQDHEWQACLARCVELARDAGFVVASGSLPPGVPEDFYARLARQLPGRAALVLDACGAALAQALQVGVSIVKPSLAELRQLTGEPLETAQTRLDACRRLVREQRARMVALSLGRDGALLVTTQGAWTARGLVVPVAGTVGAGDSFVGGLVHALAQGAVPALALRHAIAASAATVQAGGTALCDARQVALLLEQAHVQAL